MIQVVEHPLLDLRAFRTSFPDAVGSLPPCAEVRALLDAPDGAPLARSEEVRGAIRRMLRHSGYRPAGRGKPSSEYLVRTREQGPLPGILLPVDACNAVSLHSGVPISVVDQDLLRGALSVRPGGPGDRYVFNRSGQEIDLEGLLCLADGDGFCANAVKDSQRTKTSEGTRRTLTLLWGSRELPEGHLERCLGWYQDLLRQAGAEVADVEVSIAR